ncbi:RHS domain-containing protein [Desulfobotulus sp. H1]|uniref:RHS domain-containing protein n=1 Tax=Desulfobotulus pelophilus TaxID=2823377 RepID=A0ABT3NDB5_9BACT|nr:RHS domain-containing protein [Desulfobotulus pelophilus]
MAELDGSGREIRSFGWKPQGIWGTDPLYLKEAGHYYWYHNDHLGTPQMLTASSGAVVWEAKYESFGRAMVAGGTRVKNPLRFPGQYEDEETGLHYNWWRYYDPEVGRYLRVDPIGLEGGDVNLYGYAFSNPLNFIDPDGRRILATCKLEARGHLRVHFSVARLECKLETLDCVKSKGRWVRLVADYKAELAGKGIGVHFSAVNLSTIFNVYDISWLAGRASIMGGTVGIGPIGGSLGEICLGRACDSGFSLIQGVDFGVDALFSDRGRVTNIREECCEETLP